MDPDGFLAQATRLISNDWPELSGRVDAVLNSSDGQRLYVFKGHQLWVYIYPRSDTGYSTPIPLPGYPREIRREFKGLPNDLDTIFFSSGNTYAIKGNVVKVTHVRRKIGQAIEVQSLESNASVVLWSK